MHIERHFFSENQYPLKNALFPDRSCAPISPLIPHSGHSPFTTMEIEVKSFFRLQLPRTSCDLEPRFQDSICPSFLNFVENSVVHEQNLDTWKFGKGALNANLYFFVLEGSFVCGGNPLSLSEICWRSGAPIEGEREGESRSFRDRKGKVFPAREPRKGHSESTEAKG